MNKQIEDISCKRCVHYEVCRFVNALAVANVVNAENCRMFKDTKGYRKSTDLAREIFAEIEKASARAYNDFMCNHRCTAETEDYVEQFSNGIDIAIAELKKKYESEGADDENCV